MKKLILLLNFVLVSVFAFSQDSIKVEPIETGSSDAFAFKEYRVSVTVSPLLSWLRTDTRNISSGGSRLGIGGGLLAEKNFNKNLAIGTGLFVTQMGGKINYDSLQPTISNTVFKDVEYTYKTRYVDIPLMVRLRTDEFGYNRVYFEAGLGLSFLWSAKADVSKDIFRNDRGGNDDRDVNENREDFNAANSVVFEDNIIFLRVPLNVGAGWEYAISTNTVAFAGVRYSAGLFDSMRAENTKAFGSYVSLNFGVMF